MNIADSWSNDYTNPGNNEMIVDNAKNYAILITDHTGLIVQRGKKHE